MSYNLTYQQFSGLSSDVKIEIKRINSEGVYEANFIDIEKLVPNGYIASNSVQSIKYSLPQDSFSFGVLKIPSCTLKLISASGEFSSGSNENSIFNEFVRHESQIRIFQGFENKAGDYDYLETYRGFIDDKSKKTKISNDNTYQDLHIEDALTYLIKKYTFSDITTTSTTLNNMVFELFNRSEFTDFLIVESSNINAGYDVQNIDYSSVEGQTQWLKILQDVSTGHSYLYQKEGVLFYQSINLSNTSAGTGAEVIQFQDGSTFNFQNGSTFNFQGSNVISFNQDKIIKFATYNDGISEVFERLYWKDTAASFISPTNLYNRSKTFDIETITDNNDRINLLSQVGTRTSRARKKFKLKIVLFVNINVLDRITITSGDYITEDDFIWDLGNWDEENWSNTTGATFSGANSTQVVKEITHNFSAGTTDLLVEEI